MEKKTITETAADAATIAVGIAAFAVDVLMAGDQPVTGKSRPRDEAEPSRMDGTEAAEQQRLGAAQFRG